MNRTQRDEKDKELRRLWRKYRETWDKSREHGQWVTVNPYQHGWLRKYQPRPDIKNRNDIRFIRQALDLLNSTVYCRNKNFMRHSWRDKKDVPIEQPLRKLTEEQFNKLSEKMQSYFTRSICIETFFWPYHQKREVVRYIFKHPFWFEFIVEPNIVVAHWLPDSEWESYCAEISNHIQRNGLWPKIGKAMGWKQHPPELREGPYYKNKNGDALTDEIFEYDDTAG